VTISSFLESKLKIHINMWVDYWRQDVVDLGKIIVWTHLLGLKIGYYSRVLLMIIK
jgi:hypothetical protein